MPGYIADMSLKEQIGQVLMAGFWGTTPSPEILDLIQNHHIGGVILFSRNVQDARQVHKLTHDLQMAAKAAGQRYPLLIAIDQENGMVQRLGHAVTSFPGNMAQGAIGSEQVTYKITRATGQELHALGINMNLAPVVDVNNNVANPVIGVRSFGEDPGQVARLGAAAVQGYRNAGVITCLKHFPGHGDTAVDSHLSLPTIPYSMQRLEAIELVPFKSAIAAGADSTMVAHIAFPSLTQDEMLPATLSPVIVRGLLREKLGFDGVIISDCLEMKAISETVGVAQGAVLALRAGIDLVLISHQYDRQRAGIEAIQTAVQAGKLSLETVNQAAERVLRLKQRFLSWDKLPTSTASEVVDSKSHRQLRDATYELSTTLVRNEDGLLPLHLASGERLLILFPQRDSWTMVEDRNYPHEFFVKTVRQQHEHTIAMSISPLSTHEEYGDTERLQCADLSMSISPLSTPEEYAQIYQAARESAATIVLTVNAYLDRQQASLMHSLLRSGQPVIGIAVYSPYDLLAFPELATYLVTYEYTEPALAAAVSVLFGQHRALGRLPISLPDLSLPGHNSPS